LAQFVIDEGQQVGGGVFLTALDCLQNARDLTHCPMVFGEGKTAVGFGQANS
jgi:hypothetical protein